MRWRSIRTGAAMQTNLTNIAKRDGPLDTQCWIWLGAKNGKATKRKNGSGYGFLWWEGRMQPVHRLSFAAFVGPIPKGLLCLHRCDTPACINPDHLFLGTQQDNMSDKVRKGRQARQKGEAHGGAVLTAVQAAEVRFLAQQGRLLQREIGALYGVARETVSQIARGKLWPDVSPRAPRPSKGD